MSPDSGKLRVLVVDDEPAILRFIGVSLSIAEYEIFTVSNGHAAFEAVSKHYPDVILLDIVMPRENGIELMGRLKTCTKAPIIALTAHQDLYEAAIGSGAAAAVHKPFNPKDLLATIQKVCYGASEVFEDRSPQ